MFFQGIRQGLATRPAGTLSYKALTAEDKQRLEELSAEWHRMNATIANKEAHLKSMRGVLQGIVRRKNITQAEYRDIARMEGGVEGYQKRLQDDQERAEAEIEKIKKEILPAMEKYRRQLEAEIRKIHREHWLHLGAENNADNR